MLKMDRSDKNEKYSSVQRCQYIILITYVIKSKM